METSFSLHNSCKHDQSYEIDGFLTCILCGRVINEQVFENNLTNCDLICPPSPPSPIFENAAFSYTTKEKNLLTEMLNRDFFSKEVYHTAYGLIQKWQKEKIVYKKYHTPYSIYFASKIHDYPICMKTISNFLGVDLKEIFKLQKIIPLKRDISPSRYIFKFGKILHINFQNLKIAENLANRLYENLAIQPLILAISILIYLNPKIDVAYLCNISHVSYATIKKWMKIFHDYV